MMHRFFALALVGLLLTGATTWAGQRRAEAKAQVAPDIVAIQAQPSQPAVPFTPYKINATTHVIGTSWYDYGWNSGSPTRIAYYGGKSYMIYIGRPSNTGNREITYVSYDGQSFRAPEPVVPGATQTTYFSSIDVWRGGAADGLAAVAAGWAAAPNNSYYALESTPGGGAFTSSAVSRWRDTGTLSVDPNGVAIFWDSKNRTDYRIQRTTDFGVSWAEVDTGVLATTALLPLHHLDGSPGGSFDSPVALGPTGDIFLGAVMAGAGNGQPFTELPPDSADWWGYFKSTDQGRTWSWTRISSDGEQLIPGYFNLVHNFGQFDLAVDGNNAVHCVSQGYSLRAAPDSSKFTTDVLYWDATVGFKSLVNFSRDLDIIDSLVIPLRAANALGCSYATIAASKTEPVVVCVWSQPKFTASSVDTGATGVMCYDLWYNASFNGGATWKGATQLTNTTGKAETFPTLADDLESLPGGGVRARVLYLDDTRPGQSLNTTPHATEAGEENWVYQEFEISATGVEDRGNGIAQSFALDQNYPNPFNPSTEIVFRLPAQSDVKLTVHNILGQEVAVLVNETKEAGTHHVNFSADKFSSGVYFYNIKAGQYTDTKKMVLMK